MNSKVFADKSMIFLKKYKVYNHREELLIHYGLETLYILITKMIIITIISLFFNITKEMYIFIFFYGLLRIFASGMHLSSSLGCTIFSTITLIGFPYLCKYSYIDIDCRILLIGISICIFALYSPADTVRKPLLNEEKRIKNKFESSIICYIYLILLFYIKTDYILNCITYSLLLQSILIMPITYKIFNQSYNNYKKYK